MPYCLQPGCSRKVDAGRCAEHRRAVVADHRRFQGAGATSYQRKAWTDLRDRFRVEHPLCANRGAVDGCTLTTDVVDHIEPHRGDEALMYDEANLQPMCFHCHAVKTGRELKRR